MRIVLITDAWYPQVNGVVRTWDNVKRECEQMGHTFDVVHPALDGRFRTFKAPRYPEIKLAVLPGKALERELDRLEPEAIHIATEGPLGQAARRYCRKRKRAFTTSYHTQFPHYMRHYFGVPPALAYRFLRWFHGPAKAVLVPTPSVGHELESRGFDNVVIWSRGVDTELFKPEPRHDYGDLARPIFVYAGRVAIEKNIEAFLRLELPGSKVVVGDGPAKAALERKFPDVHWAGYQYGQALASRYAGADVFVFPSRTDTFGVVMLEANACGLPVAAYPVTGPIDVVQPGQTGVLDEDLAKAANAALELDREACRRYALTQSWRQCAQIVLDNLERRGMAIPRL